MDAECVGHSEINKYAESIYQAHYGGYNYGDANYIDTNELPEFNFLVGGFPCQSFSSAGYQMGFDDTRGTLFFEIARILKDKRPQYILLENVKNLLSHNGGNTFHKITQVLAELGYVLEWKIYNSKDYQTPQHRERIYIRGHLASIGRSSQTALRTTHLEDLAIIDKPAQVTGLDDAAKAEWFPLSALPELAFDHADIMADAINFTGYKAKIISTIYRYT